MKKGANKKSSSQNKEENNQVKKENGKHINWFKFFYTTLKSKSILPKTVCNVEIVIFNLSYTFIFCQFYRFNLNLINIAVIID